MLILKNYQFNLFNSGVFMINIFQKHFFIVLLIFGEAKRRYRPVRFISYSLDYFLFGLDPRGYHATNVLFHL